MPRLEDDGEAPPAPSRPTATAVPQPQVQPLPNEADLPKGELAVRPKAAPKSCKTLCGKRDNNKC